MKNGFEILWTDNAIEELNLTYQYLESQWSEREIRKLSYLLDKTLQLISENPLMYPKAKNDVRKAVIAKFNSLYYIVQDEKIIVLSFFSNRQNPEILKI
ncbi:MAG: hypothetical protein CVV22_04460 [Ignavibacteriae bacterium HGW-Ignavibacteriae-1]|jgi:plasmid stabilization system protein ParE|nr:MAG: hypothetical protein CVV22_04460 [Ignavibacteriae bacterium HGW-Ignavibacteriae-1]